MELEIKVRPILQLSEWMAAARAATSAEADTYDEDVLAWYVNACYRRLPLDPNRSPRSNMLSYNVMVVRDLPCSNR